MAKAQEKDIAPSNERTEKVTKPRVKKYKNEDLIPCQSVRVGMLQYISKKTGQVYQWLDYGDVCEVEYGDLISLRASKSAFIFQPWFVILDDNLVSQWNELDNIYKYKENMCNIGEFLSKPVGEIKATLKAAPNGFRELARITAGSMVRNNTLDSISVINALDDVLGSNIKILFN